MPDDAAGGAAGEVGAEPVVLPQAVHRKGAHQDHHAGPGQMHSKHFALFCTQSYKLSHHIKEVSEQNVGK